LESKIPKTSWGALWPPLHPVHSECKDLATATMSKRKREDGEPVVPCHLYTKPGERGRAPRPCKKKR
jgi:hypothetical protein